MVFPKLTRKRILSAGGKPVEIVWPDPDTEPRRGHKYTIQSSAEKAGEEKLIVVATVEQPDGWRATVKLDSDPHRPLVLPCKKGIEPSPMGGPQFRAETEGEQVDSRYQRLISEEGRLKTARMQAKRREQAKILQLETRLAETRRRKMTGASAKIERQLRELAA